MKQNKKGWTDTPRVDIRQREMTRSRIRHAQGGHQREREMT